MKCPNCESPTWTRNTKQYDDEVLRSRKCRTCGLSFWTVEWIDLSRLPKEILDKLEE